ncbi:T9SS type A sorting domain-containing protein [Mesohalobacter salilacus]|uniref:T9SS type A sorting domain-containing protein n=1 Tax=Mesohalobacter salilacus TaxID=2491711 RepID=UPI00403EB6DF
MKRIILLFIFLFPIVTFSQVTNEGKPLSWKIESKNTPTIILPEFDIKQIQAEDSANNSKGEAPWRFGFEHQVNINIQTHGQWTNLDDGSRFWLLNVKSENAKTMNFVFDEFYIPEGGKLYFYNANKTDLLGAYTHSQNRQDMLFGSWLIDGDDIFIYYYEPVDKIGEGKLHISKAVHGYRSVSEFNKEAKALNDSGACNLDVDCSIGSDFDTFKDDLKKSVALIVVGGSGFCTGALVNNTSHDGTPYFLTANHCLGSSVGNWAFRFNWRSPNPQCATGNNSTDGTFNQTVSGANLIANNGDSDFGLLEITAPLPSSWDLVWAGWDRSSTPANFSVGIHHPSGDIMKVCRDNDQPTTSIQSGAQVWFLDEWEIGVTEPGSSGSPLFNQDGRIIGQLFGGAAACAGTVNNQQFDYYGRFDVSWDNGSSPSTRLKEWLDPNNTGEIVIDQFPPKQVFNNDARLIVSNLPAEVCGEDIQPTFEVQNNGSNPLTSINFSYQINTDTPVNISWNGSLLTGETAVLGSPIISLNEGNNVLSASITSPNSVADEFTGNNNVTRNINKTLSYNTTLVNLTLITDDFGDETTWIFEDENGTVIDQGGPYANNITINESFAVNSNLCYSFTIFDSFGDGLCCGFGQGSYSLSTSNGTLIFNGAEFTSQETTNISITDNLNLVEFTENDFSIYPNPTTNLINIRTKFESLEYQIFDITGKPLLKTKANSINLSGFSSGIYLLSISNAKGQKVTKKIIKE